MNLSDFQFLVGKWGQYNFPNSESWEKLLGVVEEAGELCHAHLKQHQKIRGTFEEHQASKKDAIGDIMVYLAHYCVIEGLNLEECAATAWNEIKDRDWIKYPKNGRSE